MTFLWPTRFYLLWSPGYLFSFIYVCHLPQPHRLPYYSPTTLCLLPSLMHWLLLWPNTLPTYRHNSHFHFFWSSLNGIASEMSSLIIPPSGSPSPCLAFFSHSTYQYWTLSYILYINGFMSLFSHLYLSCMKPESAVEGQRVFYSLFHPWQALINTQGWIQKMNEYKNSWNIHLVRPLSILLFVILCTCMWRAVCMFMCIFVCCVALGKQKDGEA